MQHELVERGKSSLEWYGLAISELNPFFNGPYPVHLAKHCIAIISALSVQRIVFLAPVLPEIHTAEPTHPPHHRPHSDVAEGYP